MQSLQKCLTAFIALPVFVKSPTILKLILHAGRLTFSGFKLMISSKSIIVVLNCLINIVTFRDVAVKVRNLKKPPNNSRRSLNRQLQRAEKSSNISENEALLNHRRNTALGNYRKCIDCRGNFTESSTIGVDEDQVEFSFLKDMPELRRMSKFSICVPCHKKRESGDTENAQAERDFSSFMTVHNINNSVIYSPIIDEPEPAEDIEFENSDLQDDEPGGTKLMVMFPSNFGCLFQGNDHGKPSPAVLSRALYKCEEVSLQDVGILYNNQINKYRTVVENNDRFTGVIQDHENRILSNLVQKPDDSGIRGSDKWFEYQSESFKRRFYQLGQTAFRVEVEFPVRNIETIATNLLIDGFSITLSFEGDDCNEVETKYWVHLGHNASTLCTEDCEKILLSEYLQTRQTENKETRFISSYLTSVFKKMQSFVQNIIKCPASELCSEDYVFTLTFDSRGVCYVMGFIWPDAVLDLNEAESLESFFGDSLKDSQRKFADYVSRVITSTSNETELKLMGFNKTETQRIVELVKKHQVRQKTFGFPSLKTMFKHSPDIESFQNIEESEKLKQEISEVLNELSDEEVSDLSTEDWIDDLSTWKVESLENDDTKMQFVFNQKSFNFLLDKKLLELIVLFDDSFSGVYHFAISCAAEEATARNLVLKRTSIVDCFICPYSPFFIQAMLSPIAVTPVYGYSGSSNLNKCDEILPEDTVNPQVSSTHKQISLVEAFSLSDSRKFRNLSNSPMVYCNTNPEAQTLFKKVPAETNETFKAEGQNSNFELCYNVVTRHKLRMNGGSLLLAETATHYEFVGNAESEDLFSLYSNKIDQIGSSDTLGIVGDDKMPEIILCSNGQVLKKRKTMKILNFPTYEDGSTKFKYSRVLLFYPLAAGRELLEDDVDRLFYETNEDQPKDKYNRRLTIIENLERKLFKRIISNM